MADEIKAYLDARNEFGKARRDLYDLAAIISEVANYLRMQPPRISFSDTGIDLQTEVRITHTISADEWKSALDIQKLLARYYEARNNVRNAWSAVPQDRKVGLPSPSPDVLLKASRATKNE